MSLRDLVRLTVACALLVACGSGDRPGSGGPSDGGGPSGDGGSWGGGPALAPGTLLYVRAETRDRDVLLARTLATGEERVVTDLTGDGSSGWNISGYSLSPDRRRIAIASLYAPTSEDVATGLATRAIWTFDTDGTDFRRLTPTFPDTSAGRSDFQIDVDAPAWSADGASVLFDLGTYWWEGTMLSGGSVPWVVAASGDAPPTQWPTPLGCSVLHPARNPATGEMLLIHSVCVPGQGTNGLYLYPPGGGTSPAQLVASSHGSGGIDVYLEAPSWLADGSGFLFLGGTEATDWTPSILLYDLAAGSASTILVPPPGSSMRSVALSPDASMLVYCLMSTADGSTDLHLVDLSVSPPTDSAITHDGRSCFPSF